MILLSFFSRFAGCIIKNTSISDFPGWVNGVFAESVPATQVFAIEKGTPLLGVFLFLNRRVILYRKCNLSDTEHE